MAPTDLLNESLGSGAYISLAKMNKCLTVLLVLHIRTL
jgi:hypothetical protein